MYYHFKSDLILVQRHPAAENAHSAFTDVAGIELRHLYAFCQKRPHFPLL